MNLTTGTISETGDVGSRMFPWAATQNAQDITLNSRAENFEGVVITDMRKSHAPMCA